MKRRIIQKHMKQANRQPYLAEVVNFDLPPDQTAQYYPDGVPFKDGDTVLMLGEVEQMPGHVAIALRNGRVLFGWHAENFRKLTREEA